VSRQALKLPVDDPVALINTREVISLLSAEVCFMVGRLPHELTSVAVSVQIAAISITMKSYERPKAWIATHDPFTPVCVYRM
jgi:hypothetical protein